MTALVEVTRHIVDEVNDSKQMSSEELTKTLGVLSNLTERVQNFNTSKGEATELITVRVEREMGKGGGRGWQAATPRLGIALGNNHNRTEGTCTLCTTDVLLTRGIPRPGTRTPAGDLHIFMWLYMPPVSSNLGLFRPKYVTLPIHCVSIPHNFPLYKSKWQKSIPYFRLASKIYHI